MKVQLPRPTYANLLFGTCFALTYFLIYYYANLVPIDISTMKWVGDILPQAILFALVPMFLLSSPWSFHYGNYKNV